MMPESPLGVWPDADIETLAACPVCGHTGRDLIEGGLTDRIFGIAPGTWTLWRCRDCGVGYLDPRPTRATIGRAYAGYYTQERGTAAGAALARPSRRSARRNDYLNRRWGFSLSPARAQPLHPLSLGEQRSADRLVRSLPAARTGERLLDLGCGNGVWLDLMRSGGWDVYGVEPDPDSAARVAELGIPIERDLFTAPFPERHFDAITLNHVIEHLHEPRAALARCLDLLKPGGRLWIATPNLDALGLVRFGPAWRGLEPPRHLVLFTARALERVLTESGFVSIRCLPPANSARGPFLESARIARRGTPDEDGRLSQIDRTRIKWQAWRADRRVRREPGRAEELVVIASRAEQDE